MTLAFLLSLQAAAAPVAPPAAAFSAGTTGFDLAKYRRSDPADVRSLFACAPSTSAEIVVCARRAGPAYPLEEMARIFEPKPLRAEHRLGGAAVADVHVEDVEFPGGQHSHRIMIGAKMPF